MYVVNVLNLKITLFFSLNTLYNYKKKKKYNDNSYRYMMFKSCCRYMQGFSLYTNNNLLINLENQSMNDQEKILLIY